MDLLANLLDEKVKNTEENTTNLPLGLSSSDKVAFLLYTLNYHAQQIQLRDDKETKIFDWCTNLLLLSFAAIVAISGQITPTRFTIYIKVITTILILAPISVFAFELLNYKSLIRRNTQMIEKVEDIFRVYENDQYTNGSLYPRHWQGKLTRAILRRKAPIYYSIILIIMTICVLLAVWLLL